MNERSAPIEIDAGQCTWVVTFSANGEYLLNGGDKGVQVWRVEDGHLMAILGTRTVTCLAVSKNGELIAAGTLGGDVFVWKTETYEQVLKYRGLDREDVWRTHGVDFSPDSTRLITASHNSTAIVWDLATHKQIQILFHDTFWVLAAKYSPQGDRIASATSHSVRVWDSNDGSLLVDIPVTVTPFRNRGLLWFDNDICVISGGRIKRFEASTGSAVLEWPVPDTNIRSSIALPKHGQFIAYSAHYSVSFWDMSTHTLLGRTQHIQKIRSIALSPDDQFLAIVGFDGKIVMKNVKDGMPSAYSTPAFIDISDAVLDSWKQGRLAETETSLTETISNSTHKSHHALANRALVRSQLHRWDQAIDDAENSIKIRPSAIGYIAKSVALIGSGQNEDGCRVFDLAFRYCDPIYVDHLLLIKAVVLFMAGKHNDSVSRVGDLIATVELHPIYHLIQAYMCLLLGNSHTESSDYEGAIHSFERARAHTQYSAKFGLLDISLISGWRFDDLGIKIRRRLCEALYAAGRTEDAGKLLLELVDTFDKEVYTSVPVTEWISDFTRQCLSTVETGKDTASKKSTLDNVPMLRPALDSQMLLRVWAKAALASQSWKDALVTAARFVVPRFTIYRVICERLETIDRTTDASECFRQMVDKMVEQVNVHDGQVEWVLGKLESLGDTAMSAERYNDAISHYSAVLALGSATPQLFFIKRSEAYVAGGLWEAALNDADMAIELDPSSPWGYERRHAALHKAGDYENAINAFETMLSKMSQSSDPEICEHHRQYMNPGETRVAIRGAVQGAIRDSPCVLINTVSGRLLDKSERASVFESLPVFNKLISSMTTHIDQARVEHDVAQYYRYAMFSHKWEDNEPLFEEVVHIVVYDLEESPTNDKLRRFCEIVRDAGLHWAWSDTCCIKKADHFVLQEALVAMFKWYQGSALTLVYLCDTPWRRLVDSIWNSRAWTFQEYHASKVVRFYNEDWTLYLNLDIPNHKESPQIVSEMEEATGISARALKALRPGLDDIREKLCLASTRQTTLVEDAAYSLLGIFSMSLPVVYGEGDQALGKLLSQLLTSSGDTSILAWTGKSGSFNSCLPSSIIVFKASPVSHIPLAITSTEMQTIVTRLRASSLNLTSITKLHDRLNELPVASFVGKRAKLPCIVFKLGPMSVSGSKSERVFRAQTTALGVVEIRTEEDLSRLNPLYLVHPWIDFLLDRQPVGSSAFETIPEENTDDQGSMIWELPSFPGPSASSTTLTTPRSRTAQLASRFGLPFGRTTARRQDAASLQPPSTLAQRDKQMLAFRVLARLRQPFGALLLTPNLVNVAAYKRVAPESLITVRVLEITPTILDKLVDSVRVLDVL